MQSIPVLVTMAVLYQDRHFLMQLRDDKENIFYPGQWGLFGGHLELNETPEAGLIREVQEEINYLLKKLTFFRDYGDRKYRRYIFFAPLEVSLESLELHEGQDLDLVPLSNISLGYHYSDKLKERRALGSLHRRILLDFEIFARNNLGEFSSHSGLD